MAVLAGKNGTTINGKKLASDVIPKLAETLVHQLKAAIAQQTSEPRGRGSSPFTPIKQQQCPD